MRRLKVEVDDVLGIDVKLDRLVRTESASVDLEVNRSIVRLLSDADRNLEGTSHFAVALRAGRAVDDPDPFLPLATTAGRLLRTFDGRGIKQRRKTFCRMEIPFRSIRESVA